MKTVVVGSTRRSAGKTSLVLGLTQTVSGSCGYIKPFGDRLMYRKKRLWDYDAAVLANFLRLEHNPEDITIGFEHAKLTFMFDRESTRDRLRDMASKVGTGREWLFVEAGHDLHYGASVYLDPIALARSLAARLVIVAGGEPANVLDDAAFLEQYVTMPDVDFAGIVVNQVQEPADFEVGYRSRIEALGIRILGVIPFAPALSGRSLRGIAEALFAKVIVGENELDRVVRHIMVGATSVTEAITRELHRREGALIITSGDRGDVLVAAMQGNAAGIVLTNNMLPSPSLVAQATERGTPMLLVPHDTFQTVKLVDDMEPLITLEERDKLELLADLVGTHVAWTAL